MTLPLELGQVSDPTVRRALEQISLRWSGGGSGTVGPPGPAGPPGPTGPAGPSTGPAGGDLSGTYPNPSVERSAGTPFVVTNGQVDLGTAGDAQLWRGAPGKMFTNAELDVQQNVVTSGKFVGKGSVPTGGTTGQVLSKVTATDHDVAWTAPTGGGATVPIEAWRTVGAGGQPAFQNGWTALTSSYAPKFRKRPDGVVEMQGIITAGTFRTIVFTLPAGYWPAVAAEQYFACQGNGNGSTASWANIYVNAIGQVVMQDLPGYTTGGWVDLANVRFSTNQTDFPTGPAGPAVARGVWTSTAGMLSASFVAAQAANYPSQYRLDNDGTVEFRGLTFCTLGVAANAVVLVLPVGMRPAPGCQERFFVAFATLSGGEQAVAVNMQTSGTLNTRRAMAVGDWLDLSSVRFRGEV